jgi:hypothetical protein
MGPKGTNNESCFFKGAFHGISKRIKQESRNPSKPEPGSPKPAGVHRKGSTSHPLSLITLINTLFGEPNIHLPNSPSAHYAVPRGRKMRGGRMARGTKGA